MPVDLDRLKTALADRYEIERELGSGGMAVVYLAHDLRQGRQVAVKVLLPEVAAALGTERFLREIELSANLSHPHILPLHDSGEADGLLYYVMPVVEEESLEERLDRETQLPVGDAVRIAREVADALAHAHERGIIHRDIKPANVLLQGGHAVLADFGIARAVGEVGADRLTSTGVTLGSPEYMSPEQAAASDRVDQRADIYALGCVLYEMLAGEPPFSGPTVQAVLTRTLTEDPRPIRSIRSTVPEGVEQALEKALAKVPADRFGSAAEMADVLQTASPAAAPRASGRTARVLPWGAAGAVLVAAAFGVRAAWQAVGSAPPDVEANRVVVFPLESAADGDGGSGEDVATMITHALDRAGELRAIDAWRQLEPEERADIRRISQARVRDVARAQRSAFAIQGRIISRSGDSVEVALELYDAAGDSMIQQASAPAPAAEAWRGGLEAVNRLLPSIIEGAPDVGRAFAATSPTVLATFLQGEASFRRLRFDQAFTRFEQAVEADSSFALAAIRGAQAAAWMHRAGDARDLLEVALAHPLTARNTALATAMQARLTGDPETAITTLERVLAADDEVTLAWVELGEVYSHLAPRRYRPDSLAREAFSHSLALDSTTVQIVYHVLKQRFRREAVEDVEPMFRRFLAADPEPLLARRIRLWSTCVRGGLDAVAWSAAFAEDQTDAIVAASEMAKAGGHRLECAESGFRMMLEIMTDRGLPDVFYWGALRGLTAVLIAAGRPEETGQLLESAVEFWPPAARLLPIAASQGVPVELTDERLAAWSEQASDDLTAHVHWYRGLQATLTNDSARAALEAGRLRALATGSQLRLDSARAFNALNEAALATEARRHALFARAVEAHEALAGRDTAEALRRLRSLVPNGPQSDLEWRLIDPLGFEQLKLAELLEATGELDEALIVASVFDAPVALSYVIYLPASLRLRARVAEALNREDEAEGYRVRLARLQGGEVPGPRS